MKLNVSSLTLDRWTSTSSLPLVEILPMEDTRFRPGLSDFADNLEALHTYMSDIIRKAVAAIPHNNTKQTPIYVYATAG